MGSDRNRWGSSTFIAKAVSFDEDEEEREMMLRSGDAPNSSNVLMGHDISYSLPSYSAVLADVEELDEEEDQKKTPEESVVSHCKSHFPDHLVFPMWAANFCVVGGSVLKILMGGSNFFQHGGRLLTK